MHNTVGEDALATALGGAAASGEEIREYWDGRARTYSNGVLGELACGRLEARADTDVWSELWTQSEQAYYATSPMFLVEAVR